MYQPSVTDACGSCCEPSKGVSFLVAITCRAVCLNNCFRSPVSTVVVSMSRVLLLASSLYSGVLIPIAFICSLASGFGGYCVEEYSCASRFNSNICPRSHRVIDAMCGPYRRSTEPSARLRPLELRKSTLLRSPWRYVVSSLLILPYASRTVILIPETLGCGLVVASEHTPKTANTERPSAKSDLCKGVTPGRGTTPSNLDYFVYFVDTMIIFQLFPCAPNSSTVIRNRTIPAALSFGWHAPTAACRNLPLRIFRSTGSGNLLMSAAS